jgi:hypothetical protein
MKLEIFKNVTPTPQPNYLNLKSFDVGGEIEVRVVDAEGKHKFTLVGIRTDGKIVRYSGSAEQKRAAGFKVNENGQIQDCLPATSTEFFS